MSSFHDKNTGRLESPKSHLNFMGGRSFDVTNPLVRLRLATSSCFFGEPQYYQTEDKAVTPKVYSAMHATTRERLRTTLDALDPSDWRSKSPAEMIESAIDAALDHDAEATLREAVRLRHEEHMRTTPQVILVRAAHHARVRGTGLVRTYGSEIVSRADEPAVGLAYHLHRYGADSPVPNSLKRLWKERLESFDGRQLAKYRMEGRGVKTVDVVNLTHPKSPAVDLLVKGELKTTDQTWESIVSAGGSNPETWAKALDVMGHMALLRNLRNLLSKGADAKELGRRLEAGAAHGKQLPFRYYSAYKAVEGTAPGHLLDSIEKCMRTVLDVVPKLPGRTMSLCDNSGSARGATTSTMGTMQVSTIANLTGIVAGMRADEGYLGVFGDALDVLPVRMGSSIMDQLKAADVAGGKVGQATENGIWIFFERAIRTKEHWDNIFVFSDMQAGHGGLYGKDPGSYRDYVWTESGRHIDVSRLVSRYRKDVNPNVNVFLVQVAGYQDTIVPEFYRKTYVLGGWGEGVLRFAAEMASLV